VTDDRWEPVPVPLGDGRHDIGDDVRAAIVQRLMSEWSRDPDLTPEKVRHLAQWAGALKHRCRSAIYWSKWPTA
jgi:hypothetical protein